ncbi:hypothetical protein [Microseira wollei]|uniref:hypothetical protein n=1 Tax=Microseira wollei TaxID=467598 RepID=UPI001CFEACF7|nr:hypothetical protein [Microseira wollei]
MPFKLFTSGFGVPDFASSPNFLFLVRFPKRIYTVPQTGREFLPIWPEKRLVRRKSALVQSFYSQHSAPWAYYNQSQIAFAIAEGPHAYRVKLPAFLAGCDRVKLLSKIADSTSIDLLSRLVSILV